MNVSLDPGDFKSNKPKLCANCVQGKNQNFSIDYYIIGRNSRSVINLMAFCPPYSFPHYPILLDINVENTAKMFAIEPFILNITLGTIFLVTPINTYYYYGFNNYS